MSFLCTFVLRVTPELQEVSVREISEFLLYTNFETWKNYDSNRKREFFRFNFQETIRDFFSVIIPNLFLLSFDNKYPLRRANMKSWTRGFNDFI